METKPMSDLRGDPKNPRTISDFDFNNLKATMKEFGDLGGVILNIKTGQLVGGHQRVKSFENLPGEKNIVITKRFDAPNSVGTVAVGYVTYNGEFYSYREVEWPLSRQRAANIAANNISGTFDKQLLAEVTYEIQQDDASLLALTGQSDEEISKLMQDIGVEEPPKKPEKDDDEKLNFSLTKDQKELVVSALDHIRITRDIPSQDGDAMNGAALYYMAESYLAANSSAPSDDLSPIDD